MRTIRRLYFYAVALISLEVVIWGLIGLLRSIFSSRLVSTANVLAQALALVLVGLPIFLLVVDAAHCCQRRGRTYSRFASDFLLCRIDWHTCAGSTELVGAGRTYDFGSGKYQYLTSPPGRFTNLAGQPDCHPHQLCGSAVLLECTERGLEIA